jgi:hypothetical protein
VLELAPAIEAVRPKAVYSGHVDGNKYLLMNGRDLFMQWQAQSRRIVRQGYSHVVRTDITSYFDNILLRPLFEDLDRLVPARWAYNSLRTMLNGWSATRGMGLPQGPDASRLLANLYLHQVDQALIANGIVFTRYMDDYRLFGRSSTEVRAASQELHTLLRYRGLSLSSAKTKLLIGKAAIEDTRVQELDDATYILRTAPPRAGRRLLRKLVKQSIKKGNATDVKKAKYSIYRLLANRDSGALKHILANLTALAPLDRLVAIYLAPWVKKGLVERGVDSFLSDRRLNVHQTQAAWLLAMMMEHPAPPEGWVKRARIIAMDKNEPYWLRGVAAQVLGHSGSAVDREWLLRQVRLEPDARLVRDYLVALRRGGKLPKDVCQNAARRLPELLRCIDYLGSVSHLPSIIDIKLPRHALPN